MRNIKGFYGSQVAKLPNYLYRGSDNIQKAVTNAVLQGQHSGKVRKTPQKYTKDLQVIYTENREASLGWPRLQIDQG